MRVPTKKLEEYSDKYEFAPATRRFWTCIFRRAKNYHETFLVDFHEINEEIGKTRRRGKFVRATMLKVKEELFDCPFVKVVREHTSYLFQIQVLPFAQKKIDKQEEKVTHPSAADESQDIDTEGDLEFVAEDSGIDQQQLISTDILCREVGIKFQKQDLPAIAAYGQWAIKTSIKLFKRRSLTSKIQNPCGWLRRCLQRGWYRDYDEYQIPVSIIDQFKKLGQYLVENLGTVPLDFLRA